MPQERFYGIGDALDRLENELPVWISLGAWNSDEGRRQVLICCPEGMASAHSSLKNGVVC